jgi:hypothetical protein
LNSNDVRLSTFSGHALLKVPLTASVEVVTVVAEMFPLDKFRNVDFIIVGDSSQTSNWQGCG